MRVTQLWTTCPPPFPSKHPDDTLKENGYAQEELVEMESFSRWEASAITTSVLMVLALTSVVAFL
ncbi:13808_t:CDS:2, partial [Acaulospora colombiana]